MTAHEKRKKYKCEKKCPFCGRKGWEPAVICPCEFQKTLRQAWEELHD